MNNTILAEILATQRELATEMTLMRSRMDGLEDMRHSVQLIVSMIGAGNGGSAYALTSESTQLRMISRFMTSNADKDSKEIAEEVYGLKSNNHRSNLQHVNRVMEKYPQFFNQVVERFPNFNLML